MRTEPFLVLLTVLLLAQAASSKEEAVDLGPHRVTFSLPSSVECALTVAEPLEGRTPTGIDYIERSIDLDCGGGRASISLRAHQSPVPAGDGVVRALSKKTPWGIGDVGVETEARHVDRQPDIRRRSLWRGAGRLSDGRLARLGTGSLGLR